MAKVSILNLGAGKTLIPLDTANTDLASTFIVNLDPMYYDADANSYIEGEHDAFMLTGAGLMFKTDEQAVPFMERYSLQFDKIVMYRYLEHVAKDQLLYFIYLLSTSLKVGGEVDVIVPNYQILAERILTENVDSPTFDKEDIITTTELLNEPSCPHASVWTPQRAIHYFTYEDRFTITMDDINPKYSFDGRDIYMRFKAVRKK